MNQYHSSAQLIQKDNLGRPPHKRYFDRIRNSIKICSALIQDMFNPSQRNFARYCNCRDLCKFSLWSVKYILNQGTANFGQISSSIKISSVGRPPGLKWKLSLVGSETHMIYGHECQNPKVSEILIKIQNFALEKCIWNIIWEKAVILSRESYYAAGVFQLCLCFQNAIYPTA